MPVPAVPVYVVLDSGSLVVASYEIVSLSVHEPPPRVAVTVFTRGCPEMNREDVSELKYVCVVTVVSAFPMFCVICVGLP